VPLPPLFGHDDAKQRLSGALAAGRLPAALLLTGPWGVGKQRLGLWLGAALLCERDGGAPCEACASCRMVATLTHPDLHWFFPIPRPRAGDDGKQAEEAEESLIAALAARREQPLYGRSDGMHALYLPLVRVLHRRAQMRPAMARRKVFVVGEADRLVPQASSPEAANAMLKVLEEPPPDTFFILTTAELPALLPTIRSRLVQLRVRRLPAAAIERFLTQVPDPPLAPGAARRRAERAGGSIGEALAPAAGDEPDASGAELLAVARKGAAARWRYVLGVRPWQARGAFTGTLDAALDELKDELERRLRGADTGGAVSADALVGAIRSVEQSRRLAQGNVNPQLIAADLLRSLTEAGV
jgi:DNA polymerase-3 subunit delta'